MPPAVKPPGTKSEYRGRSPIICIGLLIFILLFLFWAGQVLGRPHRGANSGDTILNSLSLVLAQTSLAVDLGSLIVDIDSLAATLGPATARRIA